MGNIIVTEFITLDGVIETPSWSAPYWNDDIAAFKATEFNDKNGQLIGRVTYDGFAAAWPDSKDEGAAVINAMPKYVVSTTLKTADWNNSHIISENVADEIRKLKAEFDGDLIVSGSATLVNFLVKEDLVDLFHLLVYPVVVGKGLRLFNEDTETTLKLIESKAFGSVTLLRYQPDRES
mgnify:CR=1 FL=1